VAETQKAPRLFRRGSTGVFRRRASNKQAATSRLGAMRVAVVPLPQCVCRRAQSFSSCATRRGRCDSARAAAHHTPRPADCARPCSDSQVRASCHAHQVSIRCPPSGRTTCHAHSTRQTPRRALARISAATRNVTLTCYFYYIVVGMIAIQRTSSNGRKAASHQLPQRRRQPGHAGQASLSLGRYVDGSADYWRPSQVATGNVIETRAWFTSSRPASPSTNRVGAS
jgi:hypothetical protein